MGKIKKRAITISLLMLVAIAIIMRIYSSQKQAENTFQAVDNMLLATEKVQLKIQTVEASLLVKAEEQAEAEAAAEAQRIKEEEELAEAERIEEEERLAAEAKVLEESLILQQSSTESNEEAIEESVEEQAVLESTNPASNSVASNVGLGTETYIGTISIPSQGIFLNIYNDSTKDGVQAIVDATSAAGIWGIGTDYSFDDSMLVDYPVTIGDHNYQGFSNILNMKEGDLVVLTIDGISYTYEYDYVLTYTKYVATDVKLIPTLKLQTCYEDNEIYLVILKRVI